MPIRAKKPCSKSGCPNLTNSKYCEEHKALDKRVRTYNKSKDKERGTAAERGYDSKWRAYRQDYLKRNPTCVLCGQPANVVDHRIAHKGNKGLFWTRFNHQALCTPCHNRKTRLNDMGSWNSIDK